MGVRNKERYCLPQRLRDARLASGKTIKEVAESLGISAQALSMFELGRCNISTEMFFLLNNMYDLPLSFYTKDYMDNVNRISVFFRKFSAATKRKRERALKHAEFISCNVIKFFQGKIKFPPVDRSFFEIKQSIELENRRDPELWAKIIRRKWGLGDKPIINIVRELERRGIVVSVVPMDDEVDGFSYWQDERPFIFVNQSNTAVRLRMSIAHELCHLFFHEEADVEQDLKQLEDEAKLFAGAFLLPERALVDDLYVTSMEHLIYMKSIWKVSIQGIIVRAKNIGLISDDKFTYLQRQISIKKWRKREPGDDVIDKELPSLLRQAMELLIAKKFVTKETLIDEIGLSGKFLEQYCTLEDGFFEHPDNLVTLSF